MNSILLTDFYKQCHAEQYDPRIRRLVAYYTPRSSRIKGVGRVPVIGVQAFIKEYLIDHFNENFFCQPLCEIIGDYEYTIRETMGDNRVNSEKIANLHNLGYLPLEIRSLEEGIECPIGVPMIEIVNTHFDFAWVTNVIESLMSCELWYQGCTAVAGKMYREIVNKHYDKTSDNCHLKSSAMAEFGMRGLPGLGAAMKASMGFLMSFNKTSTIPAIKYIRRYYGDDLGVIGRGMASTEHSVMCSSTSIDGDEISVMKRLLTSTYPTGNFSMVCDSYDYWNIIEKVLPKLKSEILGREGTLFVRGDSGDPVVIVLTTVCRLWETFRGIINSKGYKVLDSHIRVIYGDGITQLRAEAIYKGLEKLGFSAENVSLAAGSFSMLCLQEPNSEEDKMILNPYNRDSFGVAIKTTSGTYIEDAIEGGKMIDIEIFKDPKTDTDNLKKSQKGCCVVYKSSDEIAYKDGLTLNEAHEDKQNLLIPRFRDGKLMNPTTFTEIRDRLWNGKF